MPITRIPAAAAQPVQVAKAVTGEAPFWDAAGGMLWWVDIQGQRLLGHRPRTGESVMFTLPSMPGLVAGRRRGGLVIGLEDGLYAFDPDRGLGERLVAVEAEDRRTRINDGKADPAGRLWFGTMDMSADRAAIGSLYRLDPDGRLHRMRQGVRIPNAIDLSADGTTLYFADSPTRIVEAIACDPATGALGTARVFAEMPDGVMPDGAIVDAEDAVWIACVGGGRIERRRADGTLDVVVALPVSRPTMPALGGADGRTLFVTSQRRFLGTAELAEQPLAGDLLAVRVPAAARAPFLAAI